MNWVTGTRTWTLADIDVANSYVDYSGGNFVDFGVIFSSPGNYVTSGGAYGNGAAIDQFPGAGDYSLYCSDCLTVNSVAAAATPLPAALPMFGSGLAGLGALYWRRRKQAA